MGSRSKFHKTVRATTTGRILLHGPRPKKPWSPKFAEAFEETMRDKLAPGYVRVEVETPKTEPKAGRAQRRRVMFAIAKNMMPYVEEDARPRAERRRDALAEARRTMAATGA